MRAAPSRPPVRPGQPSRPSLAGRYPATAVRRGPTAGYATLVREGGLRRYQVAFIPGHEVPTNADAARALADSDFARLRAIGWGSAPEPGVLRLAVSHEFSANGVRTSSPRAPLVFSAKSAIPQEIHQAFVERAVELMKGVDYAGLVYAPGTAAIYTSDVVGGRNAAYNRAFVLQSQCDDIVFTDKYSIANEDGWDTTKYDPGVVRLRGLDLKDYLVQIRQPDGDPILAMIQTCLDRKTLSELADPVRGLAFVIHPAAGSPFNLSEGVRIDGPALIVNDTVENPLIPLDTPLSEFEQSDVSLGKTGLYTPKVPQSFTLRVLSGLGLPESMLAMAKTIVGVDTSAAAGIVARYANVPGALKSVDGVNILVTPPQDIPVANAKSFESLATKIDAGGSILDPSSGSDSSDPSEPADPSRGGSSDPVAPVDPPGGESGGSNDRGSPDDHGR